MDRDLPPSTGANTRLTRRAVLAAPLAFAATPAARPTSWAPVRSMPIPRSEMGATVLEGRVYVAGGFDGGTRFDRYDPEHDLWEILGPLPVAVNHGGIAAWQGRVITCGGYSADAMTAFDSMLTWDDDANHWQSIGTLPTPIGAFGLAVWDEVLYLAGGASGHLGGEATAEVWRRAPGDERWIACPPLSVAREHLTLVANGTDLFAIGGRASGQPEATLGAMVERWDGTSDRWERIADLPVARSGLSGCAVGAAVVVAGGETSAAVFATVNVMRAGEWTTLPDLPKAVHGLGIAAIGSDLFAIGGSTAAGTIASVADVYRANIQPEWSWRKISSSSGPNFGMAEIHSAAEPQ